MLFRQKIKYKKQNKIDLLTYFLTQNSKEQNRIEEYRIGQEKINKIEQNRIEKNIKLNEYFLSSCVNCTVFNNILYCYVDVLYCIVLCTVCCIAKFTMNLFTFKRILSNQHHQSPQCTLHHPPPFPPFHLQECSA